MAANYVAMDEVFDWDLAQALADPNGPLSKSSAPEAAVVLERFQAGCAPGPGGVIVTFDDERQGQVIHDALYELRGEHAEALPLWHVIGKYFDLF